MNDEMTVLLVEDDPDMQLACRQALSLAGIRSRALDAAEPALPIITPGYRGVVVTDMRLPQGDGLSLVKYARSVDPELPCIMITGHGDINLAVDAMREGAYDFITKPFSPEKLVDSVRRALDKRRLALQAGQARSAPAPAAGKGSDGLGRLVGSSAGMQAVRRLIAEIAASPVDVLVHGETGTGKELVAQSLHELSGRSSGPFVALNCGGMPDNLLDSELFGHEAGAFTGAQKRRIGKIEHASGGTLFLDELESMPMGMQVKLLRVLQERKLERLGSNTSVAVDVRVVAATKENLVEKARSGQFRLDLYYRLNVVTVDLPPLRRRTDDIAELLAHFFVLAASRFGRPVPPVNADLLERLAGYAWPGNVRELRNLADCIALGVSTPLLGATLQYASSELASPRSLAESVEEYERKLILEELQRNDGSLARSARALRVAKTTLNDKIRRYGISVAPAEPREG
ncbi:sigma-54-dependent transcriptional regulator [Pseudorhodoferax soli]|uniref:HTH-type transcriptional regulatory protein TyrR n=1 Tax=Pseudorhodoferax soli TaxID=545864 RepID=A0A368XQ39_9BURK|nr:sigma-54 dependent transcriptional regulator [Pseudorhodoferax soli]RCW69276.1 two-component system C4-dicarboxylate transport response regulator DctD [Pseudorhodoferax soli]